MNDLDRMWYIIGDDGELAPTNFLRWMEWATDNLGLHLLHDVDGDRRLSTIFIGIDTDSLSILTGEPHEPLAFETMAFAPDGKGGEKPIFERRTRSLREALACHAQALRTLGFKKEATG